MEKKENRKTLVRKSQPNKVQVEGKDFFFPLVRLSRG